jgi:hypothetical protein
MCRKPARGQRNRQGAVYFIVGLLWQSYVAYGLIDLELRRFRWPLYPDVLLFVLWSSVPAVLAGVIAWLWHGPTDVGLQFARWFFWLGLPVTAVSIFVVAV